MCENKIQLIKDNVSLTDVLNLYGLQPNYKGFVCCPIHKEKTPSCKIYNDGNYKCYGCSSKGDVIDLFQNIEQISRTETINILIEKFKLDGLNTKTNNYKPKVIVQPQKERVPNFRNPTVVDYIQKCHEQVGKTDYFQKRGLLPYIINRFRLGFDEGGKLFKKYFPKCTKIPSSVIMPYNRGLTYFQNRSIVQPLTEQHKFYKIPNFLAGSEPIFNVGAFKHSQIIFIVESPICAMSITQCGGVSVPLCGVANVSNLLRYLEKNYYDGTLVVCLDNDIAGQNATKELINGKDNENLDGLNQLKINYMVENIADECKDPNELLMKKWYRLRVNVQRVIMKIKK